MKVGLLIADGGDGSASIHYFKDLIYASQLQDCDNHCETFGLNDSMDIIDVPEGFYPPGGFSDYEWDLEE
jgi:hypothetical protein